MTETHPAEPSPAPGLPAPEKLEGLGPTTPADYAVLNAIYGALLAALLIATRTHDGEDARIGHVELLPLGAATFSLSKLIAHERIGVWLREPFVDEGDGHRRPRGRHLRRAIGELVTCTRCVGAWSGLGLVGLRTLSPSAGRTVTAVLAVSAVNDFLQAGFRAVTEKANTLAAR